MFRYISYGEFKRLLVCLCLDFVEYVFLFLMPPLGEIFGVAALIISLLMFGWIGLLSGLDMVPFADILPINTITWFIWFLMNHLSMATQASSPRSPARDDDEYSNRCLLQLNVASPLPHSDEAHLRVRETY